MALELAKIPHGRDTQIRQFILISTGNVRTPYSLHNIDYIHMIIGDNVGLITLNVHSTQLSM